MLGVRALFETKAIRPYVGDGREQVYRPDV